jgi:hypothetical protein
LFTLWGSDTIYLTGGPVRTNPGLQGTETARSFLPAKDFALSKSFYEKLGFRKLRDGDVAIFAIGGSFILQDDGAENFAGLHDAANGRQSRFMVETHRGTRFARNVRGR